MLLPIAICNSCHLAIKPATLCFPHSPVMSVLSSCSSSTLQQVIKHTFSGYGWCNQLCMVMHDVCSISVRSPTECLFLQVHCARWQTEEAASSSVWCKCRSERYAGRCGRMEGKHCQQMNTQTYWHNDRELGLLQTFRDQSQIVKKLHPFTN